MYRRFGKRLLDVLLVLLASPVVVPVCLVVSVLLLLAQGTPVLYQAPRPGYGGKLFRPYKFRTMRQLQPGQNPHAAERLTPLGRFLRRTSLDELPQLLNVLLGHMSLVGPRPLLPEYLPLYDARQATRHSVRPGLTGLVQVRGRNAVGWPQRLELDAQYVERLTLQLDTWILGRTCWLLVTGKLGAAEGTQPSEPFRGPEAHGTGTL
jgi:lipopolysaccharide/colanic/teichoic acid biosynthesis glycosyltransferase